MNTKVVEVWLIGMSEPLKHYAVNTYQKGSFFCILDAQDYVTKYPICTIFRVVEEYKVKKS